MSFFRNYELQYLPTSDMKENMDLSLPLSTYTRPYSSEKKERLRNAISSYLNRKFTQCTPFSSEDLKKLEDARCVLTSFDSGITELPLHLIVLILSYAVGDGQDVEYLTRTCRIFPQLLHWKKQPRGWSKDMHLIPVICSSRLDRLTHKHIAGAILDCSKYDIWRRRMYVDTVTVYSPDEGRHSSCVEDALDRIRGHTLIVETGVNTIEYLYTALEHMKYKFQRIIVRTPTSFDGLLNKPHPRVKKLPPRKLRVNDKASYDLPETYEITLDGKILRKTLYPANRIISYMYRYPHV